MKKLFFSLFILTLSWIAAGDGDNKMLKIYQTPTPPGMDAFFAGDPAWKNSTCTGEFKLYKSGGMPQNRTRAWITYDVENLYIYFECKDTSMKTMPHAAPQDLMDISIWGNEEIEIFIDPGKSFIIACPPTLHIFNIPIDMIIGLE